MAPMASLGFRCRRLAACARRFLAEDSGASLPLTAAVMIPLMGFIGLGTDAARGYLVKARLGDALDAAVLAGAHVMDLEDLDARIARHDAEEGPRALSIPSKPAPVLTGARRPGSDGDWLLPREAEAASADDHSVIKSVPARPACGRA